MDIKLIILFCIIAALSIVVIAGSSIFIDTGVFRFTLDNGTTNLSGSGAWILIYSRGYYYKEYTLAASDNGTIYISSYDNLLLQTVLPDPGYLVNVTDRTLGSNVSYNIVYVDTNGDKIWDYYWMIFNATAGHNYNIYYRWQGTLDLSYKILLDNSTYNFTIDANVSVIYGVKTWYIVKFANNVDDGIAYVDSKNVPMGVNIANVTEEFSNGTKRTISYVIKQGSIIVVFNATNGSTYYVYTYNNTTIVLGGGSFPSTSSTTTTTTTTNNTTSGSLGNLINKTKETIEKIYIIVVENKDVYAYAGLGLAAILLLVLASKRRRRK